MTTEAQWALVQVLDGMPRHDLHIMTGLPEDELDRVWAAYQGARAALAEPEPEGPTDEELWELWLRLNNELPDRPAAVAEFWEHARVDTLARWGK